jgi:hypothetical protein
MSSDIEKLMTDYRDKAKASRTRYQRFVDAFGLYPIAVFVFVMVVLELAIGSGIDNTELMLKLFIIKGASINPFSTTFLTDLQNTILIYMWFANPIPAMWNSSLYTAAVIGVLIGTILFVLVYFISRAIAYREVYYLDIGVVSFFVLGLILMVVAHNLFTVLYYYFTGELFYAGLAIPAALSTAVKKPFTFQYVKRLFPKEIQQTDVYKKIHYSIGAVWAAVFVFNGIQGYIMYYLPGGWVWFTLFVAPTFFLIYGWAFMTHFPGWYRRRALKAPLEKASTPLRRLTRIVGAALILFGVLTFLLGFEQISSTSALSNMVLGFVISPTVGILETATLAGSAPITSILGILDTIVPILLIVAGAGIILGKKWSWYLTMGGLVAYMILPWLGWVFPNVGIIDWIGSFSNFYSNLTFNTPFGLYFFLAVGLSGLCSVFFCYLFPKRNQYIL